jgi:hypothetical protein
MQIARRLVGWYALPLILFTLALVCLDANGAFIYLTYIPAYIAALCVAVTAGRVMRPPAANAQTHIIALALLLLAVTMICSQLATTRRKQFYLLSKSLSGLRLNTIEDQLRSFGATTFMKSEGEASFGFQSAPGTTDVIIIKLKQGRAVAVEYSPD